MSRIETVIAVMLPILVMSATAFAEEQNWKFVQSVGGISVGFPALASDGWSLPIDCDISGLKKVTVKPTVLNSGIACKSVAANVEGHNIYLTVNTSIAGSGRNAQCPPASLGHIPKGEYTVYYRGEGEQPVRLTTVSFK